MRKLVVTENITLDGVIDASEGWFAPAGDEEIDHSDMIAATAEHMAAAEAVLFGRVTFEEFRGFWPAGRRPTGVADYLDNVQKYVVSSTIDDPELGATPPCCGARSRRRSEALKQQPGKDIVATGSITLVHELIAPAWSTSTGCSSIPVMGRGHRLFNDGTRFPKLKLIDSRAFRSGVVLLVYARDA